MVGRKQVVDGLGDLGVLRQQRTFAPQPALEVCNQGRGQALAHLQPRRRGVAVDGALDLEQRVDALHRFEGDGRDVLRRLALADIGFHVGEFEELAARVRPAQRRCHRPGLSAGIVELIVAGIGIGLQDPLPALQVTGRVFPAPVAGEAEDDGRRGGPTKGPVIADIGPQPRGFRAAPGQ